MNPPIAEAVRPAETTPEHAQGTDIIATFRDIEGTHIPITKECVEVIFVQDRPHLDHCLVTIEGEKTFLKPPVETVERLLESGIMPDNVLDIPVNTIAMYANFMARQHGADPLPELIFE
jgi:hypothetical protein